MVSKSRPVKRLSDVYSPGEGKAQVIERPSQLTDVLWRASRGELGRRNVAITWMLFGSGMRINEVAQLKVKDVYRPGGEMKKTFVIPATYTKTNKSRVAYIVAPQHRQAIASWTAQRVAERAMLSDDGAYGGLNGESPLFLSKKGTWRKFAFNTKRYKTSEGIKEILVCSSLENMMRDILKGSGIQGGSSHSGRRTLATWLDRKGCDLELIRYILNHEDPEMTIEYIDPSLKRIEEACKALMSGVKMPEALKS
ncbi:site-specific integrase [Marinimicrobium sp. ABcell2]|uniref:tyrosine-type recombinase/integrase n=1 Tax=Marinimicrobium sp. ABcell2 TaxID=3069751 RepID=UPI0027B697EB|nr:site-specific integrase [Marinimicrobium sp. ABcell2]MDQ2077356.1 site-specific integrase [Marinimicrobium sp. ABcell2]